MHSYLIDLLQRLKNNDYIPGATELPGIWENEKTVGYAAMLEAQKLSDESLIPELIDEFVRVPTDKDVHDILFLISSIVTNTLNRSGIDFMYKLLLIKGRNPFLSHCLGFFSSRVQLTKEYSIKPIVDLFESRSEKIRIDSYGAIANSLHDERERILLDRLATLTRPYEIEGLLLILSRVCGEQARSAAEHYMKSKSSRVRTAAKLCVSSINVKGGQTVASQISKLPTWIQTIDKNRPKNS